MRKLLVAVDGSSAALRALHAAIALAKLVPDSSIHLVHAHEAARVQGMARLRLGQGVIRGEQAPRPPALVASAARTWRASRACAPSGNSGRPKRQWRRHAPRVLPGERLRTSLRSSYQVTLASAAAAATPSSNAPSGAKRNSAAIAGT